MQISMFDGANPFKINEPIRLIELFGGYCSQSLALKYLGMPFEYHKLSEWTVKSIQAYKDLHFSEDNTDYSANLTDLEIVDFLLRRNQSKSSLYHLAGDSIVSTVLMALFGQMLDIDWEQKVKEVIGEQQ